MPSHHSPEARAAALREIAASGADYRATSERTGIPEGTLRSWVSRYGLPTGAAAAPSPPAPLSTGAPEPPAAPTPLEDLTRTAFLADRIRYLERVLSEIEAADNPTWSAISTLIKAQSDMHRERVEVIRAEGRQLDLSSDPTALAREVEAAATLLRMLTVDLDAEPEL